MNREYVISAETYYHFANQFRDGVVAEVGFGLYSDDGGCEGEMTMKWYDLSGASPRLECFYDAWSILDGLGLVSALKENARRITVKEFCGILDGLGFVDATQREAPLASKPVCATCGRVTP